MKKIPYRINLSENEIPKYYYNLRADMVNKPANPINPKTKKEVTIDELSKIFCNELAKQEIDNETRLIPIPDEVREFYKIYRPSPLIRAYQLEKHLNTPAKIYYKYEGNNTSGSHKLNSAIAQAYYAKEQGLSALTTETGAGQWGTALSIACGLFGLDLNVFMVKCSYEQKPFRKNIMKVFGADVTPSPSESTKVGREILKKYPGTSGSLGCAISEAVEYAAKRENTRYALGSVLNQVCLHQSVIGLETKIAMEKYEEYPDIIIACAGGGSNLAGLIAPFVKDKIKQRKNPEIIAVEPSSCPSLTKGEFRYDFCDTGEITPMAKMYTLGSDFIPPSSHSGGLRYHGMSPLVSQLYHDNYLKAVSYPQRKIFEAAVSFAKCETILPAPESAHAICAAIEEALKCKKNKEEKTILFGLTGTGYFDLKAYEHYLDNTMDE